LSFQYTVKILRMCKQINGVFSPESLFNIIDLEQKLADLRIFDTLYNMSFKDYFSASKRYQQYRPTYPDELFYHLSSLCTEHASAWDCGTGTGQSADCLTAYFDHVMATDASEKQITQAALTVKEGLQFKTAMAEQSGLDTQSLDLITVSQAIHWFDLEAFYCEVKRVLKPTGIIAIWCYGLLSIDENIDKVLNHFYYHVVGTYWPAERRLIDTGYATLSFPFNELAVPEFDMLACWDLSQLMGYLSTWSAVRLYQEREGQSPLEVLKPQLATYWGDARQTKVVHWPLQLRIGSR